MQFVSEICSWQENSLSNHTIKVLLQYKYLNLPQMKKLYYCLLFLLIGITSFAQETEKLPAHPWEDVLEMNSHEYIPISKWITDINIGLEGHYTKADSLAIAKAVEKLDAITETISIKFSNAKDSNLKLLFLDKFLKDTSVTNGIITGRYGSVSVFEKGYKSGEFYIYKFDKTDLYVQNSLESRLAKILVTGNFLLPLREGKRHSIFNPLKEKSNNSVPLNQEDIAIVKEVYRDGFEDRLKLAEKQFKKTINDINDYKISKRKKTIWWVKNPISVLILPTLILLLVFVFLFKKIIQSLAHKIKENWLRFGAMALIALLFVDVVIVFCISFYDFFNHTRQLCSCSYCKKGYSVFRYSFSCFNISLFVFIALY